MAFNLRRGLTQERQTEHTKEINKLSNEKIDSSGTGVDLNGKVFCITGTIPGMTRQEAVKKIKARFPRATWAETMIGSVDYLITGFGIGQAKLKKAMSYGVPMIEASRFFK